jgi:hypothetical protein
VSKKQVAQLIVQNVQMPSVLMHNPRMQSSLIENAPLKDAALNTIANKLSLKLLGCFMIGAIYLATTTNAFASDDNNDVVSAHSTPVDYAGEAPKQPKNRDALGINDAQQTALTTLNSLAANSKGISVADDKPRKTREQVMAERQEAFNSKNSATDKFSAQSTQSTNYARFEIYDASSRLFEDFDYDGFYQTFSVTFDADVFGQYSGTRARVFADLYLSRDGGPWELYFTTDAFTIRDDISEDEFEVLTTLESGYISANYDVLVDLYEVGYSDIVAKISSDDVNDLYALPLESADRDEYIVVESVSTSVQISAGSGSVYALFLLVLALGVRIRQRSKAVLLSKK